MRLRELRAGVVDLGVHACMAAMLAHAARRPVEDGAGFCAMMGR